MDLELDPELTPHELRWDIDGTQAGERKDPEIKVKKVQPQYGSGSGYGVDPQNKFRLDINGTTDRLDPKSRSKILNVLVVLSCD